MIERFLQILIAAVLDWAARRAKNKIKEKVEKLAEKKVDEETNKKNVAAYNAALDRQARILKAQDLLNRSRSSNNGG